MAFFGLTPEAVDLLIDLKIADTSNPNIIDISQRIPSLDAWRSFTILSGAFPKNLSGFKVGKQSHPRHDWINWRNQVIAGKTLERIPTFGDYAIQYPYHSEPPDGAMPSCSIRYAAQETWIIMRGEQPRPGGPDFKQYLINAQILSNCSEFFGPAFSFGDSFIANKSKTGCKSPGNHPQWRVVGFNHHLAVVVDQISKLFDHANAA